MDSIGHSRSAALNGIKVREAGKGQQAGAANIDGPGRESGQVASPAARMAAEGAPVDSARVAEIKAAIASGNYPVDAEKIAEKMIDLDLPGKED